MLSLYSFSFCDKSQHNLIRNLHAEITNSKKSKKWRKILEVIYWICLHTNYGLVMWLPKGALCTLQKQKDRTFLAKLHVRKFPERKLNWNAVVFTWRIRCSLKYLREKRRSALAAWKIDSVNITLETAQWEIWTWFRYVKSVFSIDYVKC